MPPCCLIVEIRRVHAELKKAALLPCWAVVALNCTVALSFVAVDLRKRVGIGVSVEMSRPSLVSCTHVAL